MNNIDFEPHSGIYAWDGYEYLTLRHVSNNNGDVFNNVVKLSDKYSNYRQKEIKWELTQV